MPTARWRSALRTGLLLIVVDSRLRGNDVGEGLSLPAVSPNALPFKRTRYNPADHKAGAAESPGPSPCPIHQTSGKVTSPKSGCRLLHSLGGPPHPARWGPRSGLRPRSLFGRESSLELGPRL